MAVAERRYTPLPVEARAGGERKIGGYAAVWNSESKNLGGFVEIILPGAFNDSRSRGWPDVMARYNHDDMWLLGTTGARTLELDIDNTGLSYVVSMPKARDDVYELVQRGDVRKSSFAFIPLEEDWSMTDQDYPLRKLMSAQLVDVAPVNRPAYTDTTAGTRAGFSGLVTEALPALESLARTMHADITEIRSMAEANDLRRLFIRSDRSGPVKVKPLSASAAASGLAAVMASQRGDLS